MSDAPAAGPVDVSVIVPSYDDADTIAACLAALEQQDYDGSYEIVVVDSSNDGIRDRLGCPSARVRLLRLERRAYPGEARNLGVEAARGTVLAFTDADCLADRGWLREIALAHARFPEAGAVGGVVENANPESWVGWASYFSSFGPWLPRRRAVRTDVIPTCCLSMRREVLDRFGRFRTGTYSSDTEYFWRLNRAGLGAVLVPEIRVAHHNLTDVGSFLAKQVERGRDYACLRAERMSAARRAVYVLGSPLLPAVLMARRIRQALAGHALARRFLRSAPLVFAGLVCWAWGELQGYLGHGRDRR